RDVMDHEDQDVIVRGDDEQPGPQIPHRRPGLAARRPRPPGPRQPPRRAAVRVAVLDGAVWEAM
uniref:hypothetical protein n=1 Tax=Nocardia carnea TaxID=37328 RepID=UPI0024549D98